MSDEQSNSDLHIDSDWKAEAAKEKERLARETEGEAAAGAGGPGKPGFPDVINLFAMQAAVALGGFQGPGGERIPANPPAAKHYIDLLEVLDEKTKGNLTDDEKRMLDGVLYELRMQFVQTVNAPAPQGKEKGDDAGQPST